jgi:hypothetical protein
MFKFLVVFISVVVTACSAPASADPLDLTLWHPDVNEDGTPVANFGPTALASVRVQLGECLPGPAFGTLIAERSVKLPGNVVKLDVPRGVLCLRAYWTNGIGNESQPSPVYAMGPRPKSGGVAVIYFGSEP